MITFSLNVSRSACSGQSKVYFCFLSGNSYQPTCGRLYFRRVAHALVSVMRTPTSTSPELIFGGPPRLIKSRGGPRWPNLSNGPRPRVECAFAPRTHHPPHVPVDVSARPLRLLAHSGVAASQHVSLPSSERATVGASHLHTPHISFSMLSRLAGAVVPRGTRVVVTFICYSVKIYTGHALDPCTGWECVKLVD